MKEQEIIQPRVLKGFRDSLPAVQIPKEAIITTLQRHFASYGFVPIDTPALEYMEILLGKGGGETDKQIFHFTDQGGREVALRFDLTVPFARYLAQHEHELALPFKRYHIDKVWRGENPQKGRYREFTQCDFDIVGVDNAESDAEILSLMASSFAKMNVDHARFHVAHRGMFNTLLCNLGVENLSVDILRLVDKLRKIGETETEEQLLALVQDERTARAILSYISKEDEHEPFLTTLDRLVTLLGGENEHTLRMRTIYSYLEAEGIEDRFLFDPSITRGLDYYTGIVYETFLEGSEHIGSVCSGGRYNDLASLYTKTHLPGVGSSIGLDRLLAALEDEYDYRAADVLILNTDEDRYTEAIKVAKRLREAGLKVALSFEPKKLASQYKWAEANAIPRAIILDQDEEGSFTLRDLTTRTNMVMSIGEAAALLKRNCLD
ncbi:MAG: histidine--tRNA ligase [Spirochaetales bacterium]|nr:histidine--tRNA ligase [Spirochaetales bacterium]